MHSARYPAQRTPLQLAGLLWQGMRKEVALAGLGVALLLFGLQMQARGTDNLYARTSRWESAAATMPT